VIGIRSLDQQAGPVLRGADARYDRLFAGLDGAKTMLGGQWRGSVSASMIDEQATILGARLAPGFGSNGATSLMIDGRVSALWSGGWHVGASWREGTTRARAAGLLAAGGPIRSRSWAIDAGKAGVFGAGDRVALRVAQPMRVESGGLMLNLPISYDYATQSATNGHVAVPLTPFGREHVVEMAWSGTVLGGDLSINSYWRGQPGHVAAAGDDIGGAIRFVLGF
jgi:hypothetical protein